MELAKIERLLESYFEGTTSLEDERMLREYFSGAAVAGHLAVYKPMFAGLQQARQEVSRSEVSLPKDTSSNSKWWYGIAALLVVGLTIGSVFFSQPGLTSEEREALAALEQTREAMLLLSANFNKGAEELGYLNEFTKGTATMKHIEEFSESKNKILK
ncbi:MULTISPECIES: hypothetical protein [Altibacter]|uniref:hypothetical protein n=1 Tax=Altibacter TaxID=1535231 RepID=UPI00055009E9|nr:MULTISPECIES: hypothetical protein [Altibacter]MCW8982000.1 hypothetical protein [Altibacter sp.]MCW9037818.1 hypothetical protein [Altibacter sp.]